MSHRKNAVTGRDCAKTPLTDVFALERRLMLDAAALVTADTAMQVDAEATEPAAAASEKTDSGAQRLGDDAEAAAAASGDRREVVFVDGRVEDLDYVVSAAGPDREVFILDANRDGMQQISEVLSTREGIDAVHVISHGDSAQLTLGNVSLDADTVGKYQDLITGWASSFSENADVMFYGCDFADSPAGEQVLGLVSDWSGTDVAASSDTTGVSGDWDLEWNAGDIEQSSKGLSVSLSGYQHDLAAPAVLTQDNSNWDVVLQGSAFDPGEDTQAGSGVDIVGDANTPVLLTKYDDQGTEDTSDDVVSYRFRVDEASDAQNRYSGYTWIGIDADGDATLDVFMIVEGKNGSQTLRVFDSGSGANISPSTTDIEGAKNATDVTTDFFFSYQTTESLDGAAAADLDADGEADHYVSYSVNFEALASAINGKTASGGGSPNVTKDATLQFIIASATQASSLNSDVGGYNDKTDDLSVSYADKGAFSAPLSFSNILPQITSDGGADTASVTVNSGDSGTLVTSVTADDPNGDPIRYEIIGGVDQASFAVDSVTGDVTLASNLADGDYEVVVRAQDYEADGVTPKSADSFDDQTITVTVSGGAGDTTAPAAPNLDLTAASDTGANDTDNVTADATPTVRVNLNGTGDAAPKKDDTVRIRENGVVVGSAVLTDSNVANGFVEITTNDIGADGEKTLLATVTDSAGNESTAATLDITLDTTQTAAPNLDLIAGSDTGADDTDNVTADATPTVAVSLNGAGDAAPEVGDTVTIRESGTEVGSAVLTSANITDGFIEITTIDLGVDGAKNLTATVTDIAGNESVAAALDITLDTTAVAMPGLDLVAGSDTGTDDVDNVTADATPTVRVNLNGSDDAAPMVGDLITIRENGTEVGSVVLTSASITEGFVEITTADLGADGPKSLIATVIDSAGNESIAATLEITLDTTETVAPGLDLTAGSDTGADSTDNVTADATPTVAVALNGNGDAAPEVGDTVTIRENGTEVGSALLTSINITDGFVEITTDNLGADGVKSLTATVTDSAGNESAAAALELTVDTTAPELSSADVDGNSLTLKYNESLVRNGLATNDYTVTASGLAVSVDALVVDEANQTVTLSLGRSVNSFESVQVSYQGQGSATKLTDIAGNAASDLADREVNNNTAPVPDTTAPAEPNLGLAASSDTGKSAADKLTKDTTPTVRVDLNGEGDSAPEAGDSVTIRENDVDVGSAILTESNIANRSVEITTEDLSPDGTKTLTATVTDSSGNESSAASLEITLDTSAVAAPSVDLAADSDTGADDTDNVTADATPTVSVVLNGSGDAAEEAGDTVTIRENGIEVGSAVLTPEDIKNRNVEITTADLGADGDKTLLATVTDSAGNESTAATLDITLDTTKTAAPGLDLAAGSDTGADDADNVTADATPTVSVVLNGTGDAAPEVGDTVTIRENGTNVGSAVLTAEDVGNGVVEITTTDLGADGDKTLLATVIDSAGNESTGATLDITLDTTNTEAPGLDLTVGSDTGADDTDNVTADATPTVAVALNGTGDTAPEVGDVVTIRESGIDVGSAVLTAEDITNGVVEITTADLGADGDKTLLATVTDSAGNESTAATLAVTLDTTEAAAPDLDLTAGSDTGADDADNVTADATPTVSVVLNGTGDAAPEVGDTITIRESGIDVGAAVLTAEDIGNGVVEITTANLGPDGVKNLTASVTDSAGNESLSSATLDVVVDTAAPTLGAAAANGDTVILSYTDVDSLIDGGVSANDFQVTTNGTGVVVSAVSVASGEGTVTLTLASAVAEGDSVDVSFDNSAGQLTDVSGNAVDSLMQRGAVNNTGDTTAPQAPVLSLTSDSDTGTDANDGVTSDPAPTLQVAFAGSGDRAVVEGDELIVEVDGARVASVIITADNVAAGIAQVELPAFGADGSYSVTSRVIDGAGNVSLDSDPLTVVIDTVESAAPGLDLTVGSDTGADDTDNVTADATPTVAVALNGTGDAAPEMGDVVTIRESGIDVGSAVLTAEDITKGVVEITTADLGADGDKTLLATVTDSAGNESTAATLAVTLDTTEAAAPGLDLTAGSDTGADDADNVTADATPTVSVVLNGTGDAAPEVGDTVTIRENGTEVGSAVLTSTNLTDGFVEITTANLGSDGAKNLTALVTDSAGNESMSSATLDVVVDTAAPTLGAAAANGDTVMLSYTDVDSLIDGGVSANDFQVTTNGTGVVVSAVSVASGEGTVTLTLASAVAEGDSVDVSFDNSAGQLTDVSGNAVDSLMQRGAVNNTGDTTAPQAPVLSLTSDSDTGTDANDGVTSDPAPTLQVAFAGSGDRAVVEGDELIVEVDGARVASVIITADNVAAGFAQVELPAFGADGSYNVTSRVIDGAGNVSLDSDPLTVVIDTVESAAPGLDLTVGSDTGADDSDNVTADATPTVAVALNGTGDASPEVGDVVTIRESGIDVGSAVLTAEDITNGVVEITTADLGADGDKTLLATVTDSAGNESANASLGLTLDTEAPSVSIGDSVDREVSASEQSSWQLSGSAAGVSDGAQVQIIITDGEQSVTTTAVISNGQWQSSPADLSDLAAGDLDVSVELIDSAGNSVAQSFPNYLTKDIATPESPQLVAVTPDTGASASDGVTQTGAIGFEGTAEPGSVVELFLDGATIGETTTNQSGDWSFDYSSVELADGVYLLSAQVTDSAGNQSESVVLDELLIDTRAPALISAEVVFDQVVLGFDDASRLLEASLDPKNFTVRAGGTAIGVTGATVDAASSTVRLTLSGPVSAGQPVTLAYENGASGLADAAGNQLTALPSSSVVNNTPAPAPVSAPATAPEPAGPQADSQLFSTSGGASSIVDSGSLGDSGSGFGTSLNDTASGFWNGGSADLISSLLETVRDQAKPGASLEFALESIEEYVPTDSSAYEVYVGDKVLTSDPFAELQYEASLADGSPLPSWIKLDSQTGRLTVNQDSQSARSDTVTIRVTARDGAGSQDRATVNLVFGNSANRSGSEAASTSPSTVPDNRATENGADRDAFAAEVGSLRLSRAMPDWVISQAMSSSTWTIPEDIFVYNGEGQLDVSARLGNGAALPSWIEFDPDKRSFKLGQVPDGVESLDIVVEARSPEGESVTTRFNLRLTDDEAGQEPSSANLSEQMMQFGEFAREAELHQLLQDLEKV